MYNLYNKYYNQNRVIPVAAPFLLGALTGGVAVAIFNPYRPKQYYNQPYQYYNQPYPYGYNYYYY